MIGKNTQNYKNRSVHRADMHSFAMVFNPVPLLFTNLQTSGMYHPKAPGVMIGGIH